MNEDNPVATRPLTALRSRKQQTGLHEAKKDFIADNYLYHWHFSSIIPSCTLTTNDLRMCLSLKSLLVLVSLHLCLYLCLCLSVCLSLEPSENESQAALLSGRTQVRREGSALLVLLLLLLLLKQIPILCALHLVDARHGPLECKHLILTREQRRRCSLLHIDTQVIHESDKKGKWGREAVRVCV